MNKRTKIYTSVKNAAIATTSLPTQVVMAAIRPVPLKEEKIKIKISDCNRKYNKILHAPTEAKKITLYKQTRKMQHVIKTSNQTRHRKKNK